MRAISRRGPVFVQEGGEILGAIEVTERGNEAVGAELGERLSVGDRGRAQLCHDEAAASECERFGIIVYVG